MRMHLERKFSEYLKFFPDAKYEQLFDNLHVNEWTSAEVRNPVRGYVGNARPQANNPLIGERPWL